jgi:hypothetical protein
MRERVLLGAIFALSILSVFLDSIFWILSVLIDGTLMMGSLTGTVLLYRHMSAKLKKVTRERDELAAPHRRGLI